MARGVVGGAVCARRCITRLAMASTGHRLGSLDRDKPMTSPWTHFFCVVNVSEAKVADMMVASDAVL